MSARSVGVCLLLAVTAASAAAQDAQESQDAPEAPRTWTADMVPVDPFAAPAPFGPGEHLVYKVKVGILNAGYGFMTVHGTEEVRENPSYHVEMGIRGRVGPFRVRDSYESWFDVSTFQSWRYVRDVNQIGYSAVRHYEFYPDRMEWEHLPTDESGPLGSALPLDEIAFIYFIRSLPLEVGRTYTFNRYFKDEGNPVVIQVLGKEQREVEGVMYNTIVVHPLIRTSGLFGQGGDAELHFTDDERRVLVYLKSNIPKFPGSLTLHLQSIHEGFPLNPDSREQALEARAARREANEIGR